MKLDLESILHADALARVRQTLVISKEDTPQQARGKKVLYGLLLLTLAGVVGGLTAFFGGHHTLGTTSEVSWGMLIASYIYFVVTASGLSLIAAMGHLFGLEAINPIVLRAKVLALVLLLAGFAIIGTELERPLLLAYLALTSPNLTSPIWWMGTLYGVYLVSLLGEIYFLFTDNHKVASRFGVATLAIALAASANLGFVFGSLHARPFWSGPLVPVLIVFTGLLSGVALLAVVVYLTDFFETRPALGEENGAKLLDVLARLLAAAIIGVAFLTAWKVLNDVYGQQYHASDVIRAILVGPLFVSFWLFEVFVGLVVPLYLVLSHWRKVPALVAVAGGLSMVGLFVMRYNFVYAGQMFSLRPLAEEGTMRVTYEPPFKGTVEGFLPYTPSLVEISIVIGAIAAVALVYVLLSQALKVDDGDRRPHSAATSPERGAR